MSYIFYNPNPIGVNVGDCSVRAIAKALDISWEDAYIKLTLNGINMGDLINSDVVWGSVLRQNGFYREVIPNTCPDCYTAEDFCKDNPNGIFVLGFGGHVSTIVDGNIYDTWDSSNLVPIYYWYKKESKPNEQTISGIDGTTASATTPETAESAKQ